MRSLSSLLHSTCLKSRQEMGSACHVTLANIFCMVNLYHFWYGGEKREMKFAVSRIGRESSSITEYVILALWIPLKVKVRRKHFIQTNHRYRLQYPPQKNFLSLLLLCWKINYSLKVVVHYGVHLYPYIPNTVLNLNQKFHTSATLKISMTWYETWIYQKLK